MFLPANITLQFGDSGDFVAELQRRLATVKAHPEDAVTGHFDGITVNSVSSFQSRVGIRADGIAGPETLRRLNGVVSGDTSWEDTKKAEEEAAKAHAAAHQILHEQQAFQAAQFAAEAAALAASQAAPAPEAIAEPAPVLQPVQVETHQQAHYQQQQQQQEARQRQVQQQQLQMQQQIQQQVQPPIPAVPTADDMLLQMLMQSAPAAVQPVHQPQPLRTEAVNQPAHVAPAAPAPAADMLLQMLQQQAHAAPAHTASAHAAPAQRTEVAVPVPAAAPQAEAAPRGMIGRAMQKVDAMMQRLSQHFETRLSPDILREVQQLGQIMAQSGVKEATIPSGPEPTRTQTPARGPEQQHTTQRG